MNRMNSEILKIFERIFPGNRTSKIHVSIYGGMPSLRLLDMIKVFTQQVGWNFGSVKRRICNLNLLEIMRSSEQKLEIEP